MTVVCDFTLYRLAWILNSIPPTSGATMQQLDELQHRLKSIEDTFGQVAQTVKLFGEDLTCQRKRLKHTSDINRICRQAAELDDLDAMIAARDNILDVIRARKALFSFQ